MGRTVLRELRELGGLTVIAAIAAALLLVFSALPLAVLLVRSFWTDVGVNLDPLVRALSSGQTWEATVITLGVALGTALVTVLIGVPAAWLLARTDLPGKGPLRTALSMPYAIPPYVMAIGWITLLNPRNGAINALLGLSGDAAIDIHGAWGIVFCLGLSYFPLVMLQTHSALMGMDPSLEEAARTSGASPMRVLFTITLPLSVPAIASGALLTFLIGMASFGVPYLVGNPGRVKLLTTAIYAAIDVGTDEHIAEAIALAVLLGVVAALALLANRWLIKRGRALTGGKAGRPSLVALGKGRFAAAGALWSLVAFALVLPLGVLLVTSLLGSFGRGLNVENLSLTNYAGVLGDTRTLGAMWNSLWLAAVAATICVLVGTIATYVRSRTRLPGRAFLPWFAELPYAIPGTVLAMGFILTFSQEIWVGITDVFYVRILLFNTAWILLAAYCVKYLAYGVRTSDAALTQIDMSLEEAARTSGASPLRVVVGIVFPIMWPALAAAWVLVFLPVLGEITMSILLFGPETKTVGVLLFDYQSYESPPKAAVLATLLAVTVLAGNLLVKRLSGGKLGI
jgi:iron(III) transport system permease protein